MMGHWSTLLLTLVVGPIFFCTIIGCVGVPAITDKPDWPWAITGIVYIIGCGTGLMGCVYYWAGALRRQMATGIKTNSDLVLMQDVFDPTTLMGEKVARNIDAWLDTR